MMCSLFFYNIENKKIIEIKSLEYINWYSLSTSYFKLKKEMELKYNLSIKGYYCRT